jgi:ribosome-associated toxin RatA of RatAB toxin-antitoxin module
VLTVDEQIAAAPPDLCFQIAADVEGWPDILPHYRWVRFQRKDDFATGVVEMAAWRTFGPLKYPTWWVSEMTHSREDRRVIYHHVAGITRGMDVRWEVDPLPNGEGSRLRIVHEWDGPPWPGIGKISADVVIGPHFVSYIASRTLAGIARAAEGQARRTGGGP